MSLADYAVSNDNTHKRLYPDYDNLNRSEFQRDRDRIIHSSAFRRLEGKTQVFVYHEGRNYRTRLTHSIEVAQITRTLCKSLFLNEELGEAIALAHDIGHAPFGHAGERALNKCMAKFGGFDHNVNSLKIITERETHYPNFKGLNLTLETLEGTIKHNGPIKKTSSKWLKNFNNSFDLRLKSYPTLEAQIAALADDIAYNNHDIDDGFRAGFFTIKQLCELDFIEKIIKDFDKQNKNCTDELRIYAITRSLITSMIFDVMETTKNNIEKNHIKSLDDIRKSKSFIADFSHMMHSQIKQLHQFLTDNFYTHSNIARMDMKSQKIIEDLFYAFCNNDKILPIDVRKNIDNISTIHEKSDIICSYIADMTDAYAIEEHQKLYNINYRF